MAETQLDKQMESEVVLTALTHLTKGEITDVIDCFAVRFDFNDRGLGLKFNNPRRLAEFFRKGRELYPDSSLQTDKVIVSGEHVIIEWTLRTTLTEPFYGGQSRNVPVVLHGTSIVRTADGKITNWTDYYDGLTSRRTALAAHFEEWVEL
jgi:ketosteroid isomerase-like protein